MVDQLLICGAWFLAALFFLFLNLNVKHSGVSKRLSYYFMTTCAGLGIAFLIITTLEYFDG